MFIRLIKLNGRSFTVKNGGLGDADFVGNKIIVDPAGIGVYASTAQVEPNNDTGGGGAGGCFIAAAAFGSLMF